VRRTIFRVLAPALIGMVFTGIVFGKSFSSVTLTSSPNPSPLGGFVTFTAAVTPLTATGTVTFTDGATTLGTGTISSGTARYTLQTLAPGSHSIKASYGGDANDSSSTSTTLTQTVNKQNTTVTLASSANPSIFGSSATLTAKGLPLAASGTVTFKDGSTALAVVPLNIGSATYTTSALAGGSHSMTAVYGGDSSDNPSTSPTLTQTVNPKATSVALTSSANPTASGSTLTFTAMVTPPAATGTVTFMDGSTTLGAGTISSGTATYSTSRLAAGPHPITASYAGNPSYSSSISPTLTQTVTAANTTVALTSSASPSSYGSPVTFTATVTPPTATGTVTFMDGSTTLGSGTLVSGSATYSTSKLVAGPHSITASYAGNGSYNSSVSPMLTQTVSQVGATVALTSPVNPSLYGSSVTFTASVTPSTATGTVTFMDGSTTLGTGTVGAGKATFSTSKLVAGPHSITASYGGDSKDNGSTSSVLTQTISPAASTITVASSTNPSIYGSSVTFTATVKQSTATGTVTFMDGSTTLGTGTISGGKATFSTSALLGGSHSVTAAYGGDSNYSPSASLAVTQTVKPASSSVAVSSSVNPSNYGSPVTFTATMTPGGATGTVTFKDGTTTLGTGTISGGIATYSTSLLAVKSHSITADYGGDTNDTASVSPALTQTVNQATTTVALTSSANPSIYGSSATFTATMTPATATGKVTFADGTTTLGTGTISSGTATFSTSALAPGPHSITASYGGDPNDTANTSPTLTQTVNQASPAVTLTSSVNPSSYGASVKFTAAVAPTNATGIITFMDGNTILGTATLSSGKASYTTSGLAVGSHSVTAVYGGDSNHNANTSSIFTQTVKKATSSMVLSSSGNPSSYSSAVTFTVTLAPGSETGVVTFKDGNTLLGTGAINGGIATYTTGALAVGSHSILASYAGDLNFNTSTPATLRQVVNQASTTVTLTSSANPSAYGSSATFTATVTPPTAAGAVTFKDGSTTLGTGAISNGIAIYSTSVLALGPHSVTASYGGDTNDIASTSPILAQAVSQASTTVTLTSPANPSGYGSPVSFTATVTPPTATGAVTFTDGSATVGTGVISSGTATYSTSALAVGPHSIVASYGGDTNDSASGSTTLMQAVNQARSTVTLTSSANPAFGTPVTFTAAVSPTSATGTVTFADGSTTLGTSTISNGAATYSIGTLTPGLHSITASYGGDTNDSGSTSSVLPQTITLGPQLVTTSLPAGTAGLSYSATLVASAGAPAYSWSITNGNLPAGLSLDPSTGAITGIPTAGGTSNFTVQVADTNSLTATQPLSIVVSGSLNTSRYRHSATMLNNGQILVVGGVSCPSSSSCTYLNSAELYNPDSSLFANSGTMATARSAPTVLLNNGKVLVAGGYSCDGSGNCSSLSSAEIYDPATGTFGSAGTMTVARSDHTMTVLGDGTVLIASGQNCTSATSCSALSSAEIYDPKAGTFTSTSSVMSAPRFGASPVLLNSGSVLIAGGFDGTNLPAAAEIYSPANGFTGTGASLNVPRFYSSATLLNSGQVLVAGGLTCNLPGCPSNAAEIYDPVANTFTNVTGGLVVPRFNHTATLLSNGGVLVVGGYSSCGSSCSSEASTELFDPVAGKFSSGQSVATARAGHTATRIANGNVFISGGINAGVTLVTDEWYQPASLTPAGLVSLTVAPATLFLMPGQAQQLVATGTFNDGSTEILQSVAWSSSNPSVAAISNSAGSAGIATAQVTGATTLTATAGAVSASATLSVAGLVSLTIAPADPSIAVNSSRQLSASGLFSDNSVHHLTNSVAWSSSDSSIATIGNTLGFQGFARGVTNGWATITAALGAAQASTLVNVQPVAGPILTYSARTDNCVNGTQSGCVSGKTTGQGGATLLFQEGTSDPIPPGFLPTTISSGSCHSGWTPSSYPAYCPAPMNSTATDPDFGSYLVLATDDNTFAPNSVKPYALAWHMGSDGGWDAFSWDETLFLAKNSDHAATILNVNPAAIHAQTCAAAPGCVNGSGIYPAHSGGGDSTHLAHGGTWSFSREPSEPNVLYELSNVATQVNQLVITSSITSPGTGSLTRNTYVDFTSDTPVPCSVMESAAPGNPTTYAASWTGAFQVANDGTVSYGLTGGYDWAPSWTVTPIDTFIQPTAGNDGNYGFQATSITGTGVTSTSPPAWCQAAGCTVVDGGVTWTNIDKLSGQGSGFDIVIYRPAGTSAPGCTRINTRLGKIYRGTGNSAPTGYMTTNDEVACTRAGTYPAPCLLPDRFTLHEAEQGENGQFVTFAPNGGEGPNSPGKWNSGTLSCQASNTSWQGAYSPASVYSARNVVSYSGLYYTALTSVPAGSGNAPSGTTASNAYWSNTESYCNGYFFDTTSTLVSPLTDWVKGSGHSAAGYLHKYYGHSLSSMLYGVTCPDCPVVNGSLNPGTPMLLNSLPCDNHGTYRNSGTSDVTPIFTATTDVPASTARYVAACYDELCAFDSSGSGLTYRFGHTYNTGSSPYFAVQNNIGVVSPLGDLMAFGSDMMGTRGSNAAPSAACNNLRGQYQPSPGGTVTYQDYVYPVTANGYHNVFQATGCGTNTPGATCAEGATLPKWDTDCTTSCTDGGVTWTNLRPNTCRGDIVILDVLGAHAAP
jgi:hypothetical protein